jgi:hypothetical protein
MLFPATIGISFVFVRDKQQFKAHPACALAARWEFLPSLEAGFMRQAVGGVYHFIDPRSGNHLTRLVELLAGIGSHAFD